MKTVVIVFEIFVLMLTGFSATGQYSIKQNETYPTIHTLKVLSPNSNGENEICKSTFNDSKYNENAEEKKVKFKATGTLVGLGVGLVSGIVTGIIAKDTEDLSAADIGSIYGILVGVPATFIGFSVDLGSYFVRKKKAKQSNAF